MNYDNQKYDRSQERLQETVGFDIPVFSEDSSTVDRVGDEMRGIGDETEVSAEARQGGILTNHTTSSDSGTYINERYRKIIESEDENEILFEDNKVDTVLEKNYNIKNTDVKNIDDSLDVKFSDATADEDLGEPIDIEDIDNTLTIVVPQDDSPIVEDEDKLDNLETTTMQDVDIKKVLEGVQDEFKSVPISQVDGKFQISQEYLDNIKKKVEVASKIYTKKYALRRLSKTLKNIGKLSDGVKIMKKDSIYTTPPSLEANKLLLDILKDDSILDLGNGKSRKATLSEMLRKRANGDTETIKSITVTNT